MLKRDALLSFFLSAVARDGKSKKSGIISQVCFTIGKSCAIIIQHAYRAFPLGAWRIHRPAAQCWKFLSGGYHTMMLKTRRRRSSKPPPHPRRRHRFLGGSGRHRALSCAGCEAGLRVIPPLRSRKRALSQMTVVWETVLSPQAAVFHSLKRNRTLKSVLYIRRRGFASEKKCWCRQVF